MQQIDSISLIELNNEILRCLKQRFSTTYWVRAEISELRESNGHCFMELIETDKHHQIVSKNRAVCWANTYHILKDYFEESTGQTFTAGIKILIAVSVDFSGIYGISLNIKDIEPQYTVGKLVAERLRIIKMLDKDGIAEMNKSLLFPAIPQRIAVISSATAAGYGDFINQLQENVDKYKYYIKLFPAIVQGTQAEKSIIEALDSIYHQRAHFDVVVIVRGGGAVTDLSCFDSYNIALNVAQFPLPILSGIGHQRDATILDMIAHRSLKTPTAVAEFILNKTASTENEILLRVTQIERMAKMQIERENNRLTQLHLQLQFATKNSIQKLRYTLTTQRNNIRELAKIRITTEKQQLQILQINLEKWRATIEIKNGFAIPIFNGKRIESIAKVKKGDILQIYLPDGMIESEVMLKREKESEKKTPSHSQ